MSIPNGNDYVTIGFSTNLIPILNETSKATFEYLKVAVTTIKI